MKDRIIEVWLNEGSDNRITTVFSFFKHGAHGVAKFFGRKMKLRSSWKSKFKVAKKNESASEPVSPVEQKPRKHIQQDALQKDDDIKEEISTISAVFADDSFFQVSLVENENINEKQLGELPLFIIFLCFQVKF